MSAAAPQRGAWRRARAAAAPVLALALLLAPRASHACSKCLSGRSDETRLAYILTTVFLSLLPLLAIGGLVWWLVRRARAQDRMAAARPEPAAVRRPVSESAS